MCGEKPPSEEISTINARKSHCLHSANAGNIAITPIRTHKGRRDAIENINGLIIQYIPKSTLFSKVSHQQIIKIINIIYTIAREKLKFSNSKWVLFWKDLGICTFLPKSLHNPNYCLTFAAPEPPSLLTMLKSGVVLFKTFILYLFYTNSNNHLFITDRHKCRRVCRRVH